METRGSQFQRLWVYSGPEVWQRSWWEGVVEAPYSMVGQELAMVRNSAVTSKGLPLKSCFGSK